MGEHIDPLTFTLAPGMAPAAPLMRMLARFDREKVEAFAEISIALLDIMDGDPDREGECSEDEVSRCTDMGLPVPRRGAGCPISDPAEDDDEDTEHDGREPQDGY